MIPTVKLSDYQYNLPEDRIRKHALEERDQSKLICYDKGVVSHHKFKSITDLMPEKTTLFFNNTKVIPARLHFTKSTGAIIEVFLLHPVLPSNLVVEAMTVTGTCIWQCMIGNLKKWKGDVLICRLDYKEGNFEIRAILNDKEAKLVEFQWDNELSFAEVVEAMGEVPLPPYFHRKPEDEDRERYQTVYSLNKGAVAAPTAGLHFTEDVLQKLSDKEIIQQYLTLHVSAGTFQPVKEEDATQHPMHSEQMIITRNNIEHLVAADKIGVVGTTSMRSLESLYWFGLKLLKTGNDKFHIEKLEPYQSDFIDLPSRKDVFTNLLDYMVTNDLTELRGDTEIFIMPGYRFQVCDFLITNFHQPGSTLLMLIAAFIGDDWKRLYNEALANDYKFLSYGDSSILFPEKA